MPGRLSDEVCSSWFQLSIGRFFDLQALGTLGCVQQIVQ